MHICADELMMIAAALPCVQLLLTHVRAILPKRGGVACPDSENGKGGCRLRDAASSAVRRL